MVQFFLLFVLIYIGLLFCPCSESLLGCILSGPAIDSTGKDPFMQSTTKVQSVTFTRGEFSFILDHGCVMYILGLLCNVVTLALNVSTFQRPDVSTLRR